MGMNSAGFLLKENCFLSKRSAFFCRSQPGPFLCLKNLSFVLNGDFKEDLSAKIEALGGKIAKKVEAKTAAVISSEAIPGRGNVNFFVFILLLDKCGTIPSCIIDGILREKTRVSVQIHLSGLNIVSVLLVSKLAKISTFQFFYHHKYLSHEHESF